MKVYQKQVYILVNENGRVDQETTVATKGCLTFDVGKYQ